MTIPFLKVSELSFSYTKKSILDSVSFSVAAGEYVSIVGQNGAGKSTLLKCIIGILHPQYGSIGVAGKVATRLSQRELAKQIAYVPQATGRYSPYSVYEHVMISRYPYLKPFAAPGKCDRDCVLEAIDKVGLAHFANSQVNSLSGGERQKVYLAAALAQGASLLLLDEPTTFLDPKCTAEIVRLLHDVNVDEKMTILSVTHDINAAAATSTRVMALKNGKIEFDDSPARFMDETVLQNIFSAQFSVAKHAPDGRTVAFLGRC